MKNRLSLLIAGAVALGVASHAAMAADIVDTAVAANFNTLVAARESRGPR